jgi:hypothetical protein
MCLATIDQFLATCSNPRWHRWNNIKFARYILLGAVIVCILHGIPFALYYDHIVSPITNITSCIITNVIFQNYQNFFDIPALLSMIPAIIMTLFGVLAYRNVQKIAYRTVPLVRRELDKQLTKMVLIQVLYNLLAVVPLSIQTIIFIIIGSSSDSFVLLQRALIVNLADMLYFFHFVVCINYFEMFDKLKNTTIVLGFVLYICMCIKTISSTINLCSIYNPFESMASSKND